MAENSNFSSQAPIVSPTKNSTPLPSLRETKNIDTVLSEQVQKKISENPLLKNQTVTAASHDQMITLEGSVEEEEQANAAIHTAKSIKGVKGVKSQLTIKLLNSSS